MAYDQALAERVRALMHGATGVTEKSMFGGLAFMTRGNMTVGVNGSDLVVRIDPDDTDDALTRPGTRPFDISPRPMKGWIMVAGDGLDDKALKQWVTQARDFVATLPSK
jgi:TfoX/Sxy family transcriptional regulator of competence genes